MGIVIDQEAIKSWYKLEYPNNNSHGVGSTFNIIFLKCKLKKYGYCKVFTYKDKALKGKVFFIALAGNEYHQLVRKYFGALENSNPPLRSELTRVCGATIEHDWMFQ
jgi:hypothetical protein